jgi:hypothetical protein
MIKSYYYLHYTYIVFTLVGCSFTYPLQGSLNREWSNFLSNDQNKYILELALTTRLGKEIQLPEDETIFLLVESVASGKSLIDLASEFQSVSKENKHQKIEFFKNALTKFAKAIAELHMKTTEKTLIIPQPCHFLTSLTPRISLYQKMLDENNISIQLEEIELFCEDLDKLITFRYPSHLYVYRDLNWGNVFYDESKDQITFIDTHTFHWCLDPHGEPTQNFVLALCDYQIAFYMLDIFNNVLSIDEIDILAENYSQTYRKEIGFTNQDVINIYFKTFNLLTFINAIHESLNSSNSIIFKENKEKSSEQAIENIIYYLIQMNQLKSDFYNLYKSTNEM